MKFLTEIPCGSSRLLAGSQKDLLAGAQTNQTNIKRIEKGLRYEELLQLF